MITVTNPDTLKQIYASLKDIEKGRVKEVTNVQDMLNELDTESLDL